MRLPASRREVEPEVEREAIFPKQTQKFLQKAMLHVVVSRHGTAKRALPESLLVGGKTGTAEKVVNGRYARSALLNSFLATFPTDDPQYVVLVTLDEPQRVAATNNAYTAGVNAAPTVAKVVARIAPILGVPPKLEAGQDRFDAKVSATY